MRHLWIKGLRLWYNEKEYLEAMECWDTVIEGIAWNDLGDSTDRNELPENGDFYDYAELLVFMAGCHLDAQHVTTARRYLRRAIQACHANIYSETAIHAIQEYVFSYDEEAHQQDDGTEALAEARRMIAWAIQHKCPHWNDPYQRPGYAVLPLSPANAWYPRNNHPPWCTKLEENYLEIKEEFISLAGIRQIPTHWPRVGSGNHRDGAGQHDDKVVRGDWREIVLFGSGATKKSAPRTCALIQQHVPDAVHLAEEGAGEIILSVLAPNSRIRPHCGTTNLRLTAHLGLSIPMEGRCEIRVRDTWHGWREGEFIVFDDSFEHEVVNETNESRAVLLIRFWHPLVGAGNRQQALEAVLQAQEDDINRRFNPPLPPEFGKNVPKRGLRQDSCPRCFQQGYESIQVLDCGFAHDVSFTCTCGEPIA